MSNSDSSQRRHAAGRSGNRGRRLRRSGPGRGQVRHPRCRRGTSRRQLTAVEPIGGIRAIESLAERLRQAPEPPTPYKGPGRVERQGRPPGVLRDGPVRPRKFGHVGAVSTVVRIEPSAVGSATVAMSAGIQSAVSQDGLAGNEAGADLFGLQKRWCPSERSRRPHQPAGARSTVRNRPSLSGSRRESHPPAPTDPGVTISRHRALVILSTRIRTHARSDGFSVSMQLLPEARFRLIE